MNLRRQQVRGSWDSAEESHRRLHRPRVTVCPHSWTFESSGASLYDSGTTPRVILLESPLPRRPDPRASLVPPRVHHDVDEYGWRCPESPQTREKEDSFGTSEGGSPPSRPSLPRRIVSTKTALGTSTDITLTRRPGRRPVPAQQLIGGEVSRTPAGYTLVIKL